MNTTTRPDLSAFCIRGEAHQKHNNKTLRRLLNQAIMDDTRPTPAKLVNYLSRSWVRLILALTLYTVLYWLAIAAYITFIVYLAR